VGPVLRQGDREGTDELPRLKGGPPWAEDELLHGQRPLPSGSHHVHPRPEEVQGDEPIPRRRGVGDVSPQGSHVAKGGGADRGEGEPEDRKLGRGWGREDLGVGRGGPDLDPTLRRADPAELGDLPHVDEERWAFGALPQANEKVRSASEGLAPLAGEADGVRKVPRPDDLRQAHDPSPPPRDGSPGGPPERPRPGPRPDRPTG